MLSPVGYWETDIRLQGLDIARFIAFIGMVLVNFRIAAQVSTTSGWTSSLTNALEGRAAALFVVLAGIGFTLGHMGWVVTAKRAVFLIVIGLLNMTIFDADILHFYGLYFLVAMFFAHQPSRVLIGGAIAAMLIWIGLALTFDYEAGWNWQTLHYADFWSLPGFLRHSFFNGWHPVFPWVGFFLIGMWIGRMDLFRWRIQRNLLIWGVAIAAMAVLASDALINQGGELAEIAGLSPIPPGPLYLIAASASAAATIGAILILTPALSRIGLTPWLARPGRQTLTLYVAHILLGMGILDELGLLDGSLSADAIFIYAAGFCLASAIYAALWQKIQPRGPLERVMRRLTG